MATDGRRAKVTPETKEEARKLRELWDARTEKITQAEFGKDYGVGNQSAVAQFLRGSTPLSLNAARGFALVLKVPISSFSPRLAMQASAIASAAPGGDLSGDVMALARSIDAIQDPVARSEVLTLCQHLVALQVKALASSADLAQTERKQA